ncbi:MAG: DUF116 domain-containing protein [Peptococcaceae bacterium]|nr:DUF116 domain-containing protein [Peptococcaceae bacterium]
MKPEMFNPVRKRLFIGLISASLLGVSMLLTVFWFVTTNPNRTVLDQVFLLTLGAVMLGGLVIVGFGVGGIILSILYARDIAAFRAPMQLALQVFFPLALVLGSIFKIEKDRIKNSFIEVNNYLVKSKILQIQPGEVLLLVPHCLQKSECPHKITVDINNCQRCGGCVVDDLLALREKYGIHMGVATGGTLARKYVQEYLPQGIVAVACERDLTSGIQDSTPIPVLGVTNDRPCGPCYNTDVQLPKVEEAICFFLQSKRISA